MQLSDSVAHAQSRHPSQKKSSNSPSNPDTSDLDEDFPEPIRPVAARIFNLVYPWPSWIVSANGVIIAKGPDEETVVFRDSRAT